MERWLKARQDQVWRGKRVLDLERGWDGRAQQKAKMRLVASLVVGKSVLDIGCGTGDLYPYLKGVKYLGVDQSEDMLKRAKARNPSAKFVSQNLYDMHLPKFDTVVALDLLHHQPDIEPGFSTLMKNANKCVIFSIWINDRDRHHPRQHKGSRGEIITWYTEEELKKKFFNLKHEVHRRVGFSFKDVYRVWKG
ncbi:unnamed protein product [marine sediment metagenome]|uniref:Methyltransferase domain-containing protein n=1 Tax=marine sediment metagenome TaxID=412755 RepID=X1DLA4_9ZZZZ